MDKTIVSDAPFTAAERQQLETLAETLVPKSGPLPGGGDQVVFEAMLDRLGPNAALVREGLEQIDESAREQQGAPFADLEPLHRIEVVQTSGARRFLQLFQMTLLTTYYQDDRVMQAIGLEPRAAWPEGYEVRPTDWSLLDPVRVRGKIWRDAP